MEPLTTYEKNGEYSLAFSDYQGTGIDNAKALGKRLSLILITQGSSVAIINDITVPYMAPCVFCLNETEHCVIPELDGNEIRAIYFHPCVLNSMLDLINIRNMPEGAPYTVLQDKDMISFFLERENDFRGKFNLGPFAGKKFLSLFEDVHFQITNQSAKNWPCRSRSYMMALIFMLYNQYHEGLFESEAHIEMIREDFRPILLFVHRNYDKKLSVTEITQHFHLSKTTLAKLFQQNLGESFLSYLNHLRVNMATTMLRDTLLPINEIMYRVGFTDQAHFLRTFKKLTSMTPSAYREKYSWM